MYRMKSLGKKIQAVLNVHYNSFCIILCFCCENLHSNMIRVFCLYKQRKKIPLLISRYTTVLLSGTDGTDLLFQARVSGCSDSAEVNRLPHALTVTTSLTLLIHCLSRQNRSDACYKPRRTPACVVNSYASTLNCC